MHRSAALLCSALLLFCRIFSLLLSEATAAAARGGGGILVIAAALLTLCFFVAVVRFPFRRRCRAMAVAVAHRKTSNVTRDRYRQRRRRRQCHIDGGTNSSSSSSDEGRQSQMTVTHSQQFSRLFVYSSTRLIDKNINRRSVPYPKSFLFYIKQKTNLRHLSLSFFLSLSLLYRSTAAETEPISRYYHRLYILEIINNATDRPTDRLTNDTRPSQGLPLFPPLFFSLFSFSFVGKTFSFFL